MQEATITEVRRDFAVLPLQLQCGCDDALDRLPRLRGQGSLRFLPNRSGSNSADISITLPATIQVIILTW